MVNINPDKACQHMNFESDVSVNRIGTEETVDGMPRAYIADIIVGCADCKEPFRWVGLRAGVSINETELHAPLRPSSSDPDFGLGIPGFSIVYRGGGDD